MENAISTQLSSYYPRQASKYLTATAILLFWEESDLNLDGEIKELEELFRDVLRYTPVVYKIPSANSQDTLKDHLMSLFSRYGQSKDSLIILYYGGHGQKTYEDFRDKTNCIWAAKHGPTKGESDPTLDWFQIQPCLTLAKCDIVLLLDCCYAGQAVRARQSQRIEYLCASDKDQITAIGIAQWKSFTQALVLEIKTALKTDGVVTLPAIHKRLGEAAAGLIAQPYYSDASLHSIERPPICLRRLPDPQDLDGESAALVSIGRQDLYLKLSLFDILNAESMFSLMNWLTRDSPSSLSNVQLVREVVSYAQETSQFSTKVLHEGEKSSTFPFGQAVRAEVAKLFGNLKTALTDIGTSSPSEPDAKAAMEGVKQCCDDLVNFVGESMIHLGAEGLASLDTDDMSATLRDRINMSLRHMLQAKDEDLQDKRIRVIYGSDSSLESRFRTGITGGIAVLVEYINYKSHEQPWALTQAKRMTALHAEDKNPEFRSLRCLGYLHEDIPRARYGLVYKLPRELADASFRPLSEIIRHTRFAPLELRVYLGSLVCNALVKLHSVGWYHKNVRSDNIVVFKSATSGKSSFDWDFERPYLVGFDCSRPFEGETRNTVDFRMEHNIYRHPERWGKSATFRSYHDIYGLGILLIELGTWKPIPSSESAPFKDMKHPEEVREHLLTFTNTRVSHAVGTKFANAVVTCLTRRDWGSYTEWQVQCILREEVLAPLQEVARLLRSCNRAVPHSIM